MTDSGERVVPGSSEATMTVVQAWQRYSFARDPIGWHYQPVCECGDYITAHEKQGVQPCGFSQRPSMCRCRGYSFSRMGTGPRAEDAERWASESGGFGLPVDETESDDLREKG